MGVYVLEFGKINLPCAFIQLNVHQVTLTGWLKKDILRNVLVVCVQTKEVNNEGSLLCCADERKSGLKRHKG